MDFFEFIGTLKTHEMEMKVREERETPKKKAIAFKATPSTIDEENSSEDGDEDYAMLIRRVDKKKFIRREDKATFEDEDLKEDLKRRRWVLTFIARR